MCQPNNALHRGRKVSLVAAILNLLLLVVAAPSALAQPLTIKPDTVAVPAGTYIPAFSRQATKRAVSALVQNVRVNAFQMDRYPVTNRQFLEFLEANPKWRKSRITSLFADQHYLDRWRSDLAWGEQQSADQPVTEISWFAAKAYCEDRGGELPTQDQWEYAYWDQGRRQTEVKAQELAWFAVPSTHNLPPVTSASANQFGVHGLTGLVWEWVLDFESIPNGTDVRSGWRADNNLFCGGASVGAKDPSDYGAFMRYSFRSSLKASYTTKNLGFRCVMPNP